MNASEKRRHPRLEIFSAAMIVIGDDGYLTEVKDLSQGGVRLGRPKAWPEGFTGTCRVFLIFDQETVIGIAARMVRGGPEHLGFEFLPGQEERVQALLYESHFLEHE